jgi:hypothetical protein
MKKKKDMLDMVFDNMGLSAGTMMGAGMIGKVGEQLPSSASGRILKASEMMGVLPIVHASGSLLSSMSDVYKMVKKKSRR